MVFAANTHSRFYHLVEVEMRTAKTLCGLSVAMIIEPEPCSAALHLVSEQPPEYILCNHCYRLTGAEAAKVKAASAAGQACGAFIPSPLPELG